MYVTTFYSFKGGVGRTFALVNVAVELARTGRKVLLVDFDLEAPGIHTFDSLAPEKPHPGVVEFVTDYMATEAAPDVRQYVYEKADLPREGGRMWIMPAGQGDCEYKQRLSSINWQHLYEEQDGYLFFEDVKAQWKEAFDPDYVLVDSRTGHTDVEGICTRQLPDAVVTLFFPNEQNLCGLREVVRDIKAENELTRKGKKRITLHFVMSNVPDLDDEDGIMRHRIREFREALEFDRPIRIHSYPSLALLNQAIFTEERTRSRLAKEYRRLKDEIVDHNDEDSEGAVRFLKHFGARGSFASRPKVVNIEERLQSIQKKHAGNGEVVFLLGCLRMGQANLTDASDLLDIAMDLGYDERAVLLERATCQFLRGNHTEATKDAQQLLLIPEVEGYQIHRVVQLLSRGEKEVLNLIPQTTAFQSLSPEEKCSIANSLFEKGAVASSVDVLRTLVEGPDTPRGVRKRARQHLTLALMGLSRCDEAARILSPSRPLPGELEIQDTFNYAMAEWAETGVIPQDLFARVVELDETTEHPQANREQCLALALWAIGDSEKAEERIAKAEELAHHIRKTEFSCWRYCEVDSTEFLEDCKAIRSLILGREGHPRFFPAKQQSTREESTIQGQSLPAGEDG